MAARRRGATPPHSKIKHRRSRSTAVVLGTGPVLCFWIAYILTRPLGANIGDYLGSAKGDGGLALGTLWTSVLFLATILATVTYLARTRRDQIIAPAREGAIS